MTSPPTTGRRDGGPLAMALVRLMSAQTLIEATAAAGAAGTLAQIERNLRLARARLMAAVAAIDEALGTRETQETAETDTADDRARDLLRRGLALPARMDGVLLAVACRPPGSPIVEECAGDMTVLHRLERMVRRHCLRRLLDYDL